MRVLRVLFGALATLCFVLVAGSARAEFKPPPFTTSVLDEAGKLTAGEHAYLTGRIENQRLATGFVLAVYVAGSLQGENIDDAAYQTFRAWKIGDKDKDNGVLLMIAPNERKVRIETGKGTGGALTDLQSNVIIREKISPLLKQDRFRDAIEVGIDGIYGALSKDATPSLGGSGREARPHTARQGGWSWWLVIPIFFVLLPILVFAFVIRTIVRAVRRAAPGGYRGGYRNDDPYVGGGPIIFPGGGGGGWGGGNDGGSGGGDSGGGSDWGGGGSSDYSGGGDSGGGGSSDSY